MSLFPDINVWLAATAAAHIHHSLAAHWLNSLDSSTGVCFCRVTQMGLLRLLTTETVMRHETLTQLEAWRIYDALLEDERISWLDEPANLEAEFRALSSREHPAPKTWTDAYLASFATTADLTLVTFDQAFRGKVKSLRLLSP